MNNIEQLRLIFRNNPHLQSFSFARRMTEEGFIVVDIKMTLIPNYNYLDMNRCSVWFYRCENISVGAISSLARMQLELYDRRYRQYEYICYKIADEEHSMVSFECESFWIEPTGII